MYEYGIVLLNEKEQGVGMGNILYVTGGARSGKSGFAQMLAGQQAQDVIYVATAVQTDSEMKSRIEIHQQQRPSCWKTIEAPYQMERELEGKNAQLFLIDCMTVYLTNMLLCMKEDWSEDILNMQEQKELEHKCDKQIDLLLQFMKKKDADFVVVSNEVGGGLVPANALGRIFRDIAGRMNQKIAKAAKEAYVVISGIPLKLKGDEV